MRRLLPLLVALACALAACKPRSGTKGGAEPGGDADELTQTLQTENGLVTARYPASFNAKRSGANSVILSHAYPFKGGAAIGFTTIDQPSSAKLEDFVRVIETAGAKTHDQWVETGRKQTTCNGQPGIEVTGTFRTSSGRPEVRRVCHFLRNGHGYSFNILAGKDVMATEEAALVRIREAARFDR